MAKSPEAFRTISEVAEWLDVPAHVLRFWESRFAQVKPVKRAGGRRYYRPADMVLLGGIKRLLHEDGVTIRGVQKILREDGVRHVAAMSPPLDIAGGPAFGPGEAPRGAALRGNGAGRPTRAPDSAGEGPAPDAEARRETRRDRRDPDDRRDQRTGAALNGAGAPAGTGTETDADCGADALGDPCPESAAPVLAALLARLREGRRPAREEEALGRARVLLRAMDARE